MLPLLVGLAAFATSSFINNTDPRVRRRIALHEAGHAAVAWASPTIRVSHACATWGLAGPPGYVNLTLDPGAPTSVWAALSGAIAGIAAEVESYGDWHSNGVLADVRLGQQFAAAVRCKGTALVPPWPCPPLLPGGAFPRKFGLTPRETEALRRGYQRAQQVLRGRWPQILSLGDLILAQRDLAPEDLGSVLGISASVVKEHWT